MNPTGVGDDVNAPFPFGQDNERSEPARPPIRVGFLPRRRTMVDDINMLYRPKSESPSSSSTSSDEIMPPPPLLPPVLVPRKVKALREVPDLIVDAIDKNNVSLVKEAWREYVAAREAETEAGFYDEEPIEVNDVILQCVKEGKPECAASLFWSDPEYRPSTAVIEEVVARRDVDVLEFFLRAEWSEVELQLGDKGEEGDILAWAIRVGDVKLLAEMVDVGARPEHELFGKYSHMQLCFTQPNLASGVAIELAKTLLDSEIADEFNPYGILHFIATVAPSTATGLTDQQISAIDFMISRGADVNQMYPAFITSTPDKPSDGVTPLTAAASMTNFRIVKHLLDRCADPRLMRHYGVTAWEIAVERQWDRGVQLFEDWNRGWRTRELGTETYRPDHIVNQTAYARRGGAKKQNRKRGNGRAMDTLTRKEAVEERTLKARKMEVTIKDEEESEL